MKKLIFLLCLLTAGMIVYSCQPADKATDANDMDEVQATPKMTLADSVKRGEHLSHIMGCHDCHTPKLMSDKGPALDMDRLLSGHPATEKLPVIADKSIVAPGQWYLMSSGMTAFVGPWGTSFAANLTPHVTGTGEWTLEQFGKALRQGKFKGLDNGRTLLPPMPWQNLVNLSDEDLANLWAYVKSLKPVDNIVPAPLPPS